MEKLLKQLKERNDLGFFIDMGFELTIYEGNPENPKNIYEGNIIDFTEELLKSLGVRDDG